MSLETYSIPVVLLLDPACVKFKGGEAASSPPSHLYSISLSYTFPQLPRYVLLLIWRLWHFNFHLTRPVYIIFIIQANLLTTTPSTTVSFPQPLEAGHPDEWLLPEGVYRLCKFCSSELEVVDVLFRFILVATFSFFFPLAFFFSLYHLPLYLLLVYPLIRNQRKHKYIKLQFIKTRRVILHT